MPKREDAAALKTLVDTYDLIFNNEPGITIRLTQRKTPLIIDMIFTTLGIGALNVRVINKKLSTLSNNEVIICHLAHLDETANHMGTSQNITEWGDKAMPHNNRIEMVAA